MPKHVINLSGGACSFWAADRVASRYGTSDMVLLFADVLIEDPELYDFNQRTAEYFGIPITRVSREMTPWELFRKEGMIGNDRAPICSIRLKREPLDEWARLNCVQVASLFGEPDTIYVGMDWTEINRLNDLRAAKPQWQWEAPMCEWAPIWDKATIICELEAQFGFVPTAYKQGFPHFNCGKRCVRAGITHFVHLYNVDPAAYLEWEREEQITQADFISRGVSVEQHTILKDRRGGISKPMSMAELRKRIEAGDETLPKDDWGGCGCGVTSESESRNQVGADAAVLPLVAHEEGSDSAV